MSWMGQLSRRSVLHVSQPTEGGVSEEMFHRAPAIDKVTGANGWHPTIDLDGIIASVVAYTRATQAPSPT